MHRIGLDRFGEFLADGARRGIGGIGRAHHFAVLGDGVLAFQHLHHHRARGHEFHQAPEEGPLAMHAIKGFGIGGGKPHAAGGDHPEARILEFGDDLAGQVAARRVRLDDRKGAFVAMKSPNEKPAPYALGPACGRSSAGVST